VLTGLRRTVRPVELTDWATPLKKQASRTWISQAEAAEYLGVTDRTIRQMICDGRLTGYRLAGRTTVRLRLEDIDAAMQPFGGSV